MKDENCIFCKIAAGEIPSETVYEDEQFRAILDFYNTQTDDRAFKWCKNH